MSVVDDPKYSILIHNPREWVLFSSEEDLLKYLNASNLERDEFSVCEYHLREEY